MLIVVKDSRQHWLGGEILLSDTVYVFNTLLSLPVMFLVFQMADVGENEDQKHPFFKLGSDIIVHKLGRLYLDVYSYQALR